MLGLIAILAATSVASTPAPPPELSAQAQAALAPVHAAYDRIEMLPPPKDERGKLHRLLELDQALRTTMQTFKPSAIPEAERESAFRVINEENHVHDLADQAALRAMIPPEGWFTRSRYGDEGETAAYFVVQHATNDRPWMHEILTRMEPLVAKGEVAADHYAHLYDRVALGDGRPQRYGTQLLCREHAFVPDKLEDPEQVNARRRALGMVTEEAYLKQFAAENGHCP